MQNNKQDKKKTGIRQINAMKTRKTILNSAMELFEKHGYENVTIRDITDKANVSLGSFYTYYESKDQLFIYINQYRILTYNEAYESLDKNKSAIDKLLEFGEKIVENDFSLSAIRVLYSRQLVEEDMQKYYSASNSNTHDIFKKIINEGINQGEIRNDLPADTMAYLVLSCLRGILYCWCLYNGKSNLKEDIHNALKILIEGLVKKEEVDGR